MVYYSDNEKNIINIKIPHGFEIKSLPQSIKINLPENIGYFLYQVSKTSKSINVVTEFIINKAVIPAHQYLELKSFFDEIIDKESENIVLIRIQN